MATHHLSDLSGSALIVESTSLTMNTIMLSAKAIRSRIYMIYMRYNIIIAALPLLLLGIAGVGATNQALAWNGDDWDNGCCEPHWGVGDYQPSYFYQQPGSPAYQNGWYARQQDAIYDHDNNLQYNPVGQCLSCHSEVYWNGFHEGYDKQWNSYQSTNQGTSINIYGNGNYVNTDQNSAQSSGPFPIGLCGSFGCGGAPVP